jgi:tetratricopeptide (TPR) repeat protein
VKNTGDGLVAAFGSAAAAVSGAVSMQQKFECRNRTAGEQLSIKVGVSSGDATAENGDYFGMPVIEAARLCDRCAGAQILAKELVAHLAGGRGHNFQGVGALELKGLPEPLAAVEVVWEPLGDEAGSLPLPSRLRGVPPAGFVGRDVERELLRNLFGQAGGGGRRVALLSGEPGIGKTRLSTHVALEAHAEGAAVLYGRCDEELGVPYGPWVEALSHYVQHAPEAVLRAHVEGHGGELSRLAPRVRGRLPDVPAPRESDPETERYLLLNAVTGLLHTAAADRPVVLVLDDLHWADQPSLALLRHVVRTFADGRLLILGTYRDSDIQRGHPLSAVLAELRREEGVERIALSGLSEQEIVAVIAAAAGHELDTAGLELAGEVLRETDGNPFFVGEILRNLRESGGVVQQADGRWTVTGGLSLPQSVREVVAQRVQRLGESVARTLEVAAVVGREFDLDLLARVTGTGEDELLDQLDAALESSLITESGERPGRFVFHHALINHTLYEDLGATRRARLHRRVAEALEELCGTEPGARIGELAKHWAAATTAVDSERAAGYAVQAGKRALAQLAPGEALRWFGQAHELIETHSDPPIAVRLDALIGLGEAQRQVGEDEFRETLLNAARLALEAGDHQRLATAVLANNRGRTSVYGDVDAERVELIEAALQRAAADDLVGRARLLSLLALELAYAPDAPRRRSLADEALTLARQGDDPHALAQVLRDRALCNWDPRDTEDRRRTTRELLELSERLDDPVTRFWALYVDSELAVCEADMQRATQRSGEARALADQLGQPTLLWAATMHAASLLHHADPDEADRLANVALEFGTESGEGDAVLLFGGQQSLPWFLHGEWELLLSTLEDTVAAFPGLPGFGAALAALRAMRGELDQAAAELATAKERDFDANYVDPVMTTTLHFWAEAALRLGDRDAVVRLDELITPITDRVIYNVATCYGAIAAYRALLAWELGRDEAEELWTTGCSLNDQMGLPLANLRPLLIRGHQLARQKRIDEAIESYQRARALAASRNLKGIIELADTGLAALPAARG